jgi:hypothetical protein
MSRRDFLGGLIAATVLCLLLSFSVTIMSRWPKTTHYQAAQGPVPVRVRSACEQMGELAAFSGDYLAGAMCNGR